MNRVIAALLLGATPLALAPAVVSAAPIASESFNYAASSLGTANGGSGWTTAWAGGSTNVTAPGLVPGVGNKLTTNNDNNGAFRGVAGQGTDGTTVWLSYLVSGTGAPVPAAYAGLSLFQNGTENVFTGKRSNQTTWGVERSGGTGGDSVVSANTTVHRLVFRIEFGAGTTLGNERITMWIDPAGGGASPGGSPAVTLTDVANFTFDRIRVQSGNGTSINVDEVFLGTTFADVVPVPVPETSHVLPAALAALGITGLVRRRSAAA
jgi:hypothetical protein